MVKFCPYCGIPTQPDWNVCVRCGHSLRFALENVPQFREISPYTPVSRQETPYSWTTYTPTQTEPRTKKRLSKKGIKILVIVIVLVAAGITIPLVTVYSMFKIRTFNFNVNNGGNSVLYTCSVSTSSYNAYVYAEHPTHSYSDYDLMIEAVESYCTPHDEDIIRIANEIKSKCVNQYDDEEVINALLSFTQATEYKSDSGDQTIYPIETIFQRGDCEDMSVLFGSLVESLGYDAILMCVAVWDQDTYQWQGHVSVGVYLPFTPTEHYSYPPSYYYDAGGNEYWNCETTSQGWMIGALPVSDPADFQVLSYEFIT